LENSPPTNQGIELGVTSVDIILIVFSSGVCLVYHDKYKQVKPHMSRFEIWDSRDCGGKMTHYSCVFGVKDLPVLAKAPHVMAHKLYADFEPAALYCLAWAHHQRRQGIQVVQNFVRIS